MDRSFISIGLSRDVNVLQRAWSAIIGLTMLLLVVKFVANIAASRVFRWSVPGSSQLGFLLAQGSEFAFVILSLAPVRSLVGESETSIIIAVVALSIAATPNLPLDSERTMHSHGGACGTILGQDSGQLSS
ncbi:MAG: cation:proton antiporter [Pseudomonadota bacterium]|nr:cation:proton antiporter [Pseudomonadota bacterium]